MLVVTDVGDEVGEGTVVVGVVTTGTFVLVFPEVGEDVTGTGAVVDTGKGKGGKEAGVVVVVGDFCTGHSVALNVKDDGHSEADKSSLYCKICDLRISILLYLKFSV